MVKEGITTQDILTRTALLDAVKAVMAMGASTNSVLHLMAIAHEAHVDLTLEDFDRISREVPYLCNLRPSGQYAVDVLHANGGVPAVLKAIAQSESLAFLQKNTPSPSPIPPACFPASPTTTR